MVLWLCTKPSIDKYMGLEAFEENRCSGQNEKNDPKEKGVSAHINNFFSLKNIPAKVTNQPIQAT